MVFLQSLLYRKIYQEFKDLGTLIDENLKFSNHVAEKESISLRTLNVEQLILFQILINLFIMEDWKNKIHQLYQIGDSVVQW